MSVDRVRLLRNGRGREMIELPNIPPAKATVHLDFNPIVGVWDSYRVPTVDDARQDNAEKPPALPLMKARPGA